MKRKWVMAAFCMAFLGLPFQGLMGMEEDGLPKEEKIMESQKQKEESESETESETETENDTGSETVIITEEDKEPVVDHPVEFCEEQCLDQFENFTEGGTESSAEVTTEGITELLSEVTTEKTSELTSKVTIEEVSESSLEGTSERVTESSPEESTEELPGSSTEELTEEISESSSEESTEEFTEEISESSPEESTEEFTEKISESSPEESTEDTTESSPEDTTEKSTDPATEEITESSAEENTEIVTELPEETEEEKRIIVEEIQIAYPDQTRFYDGTERVELTVTAIQKGEGEVTLECYGEAESSDVGKWKVKPIFQLKGEAAKEFQLEIPKTKLKVTICPKPLYIQISDAIKEYDSPMDTAQLLFTSGLPVEVGGFVKNGKPSDEVPDGFLLPEITFDGNVISKESPMYQDGKLIGYENALVVACKEDGTPTGNPTKNYCFELSEGIWYRKGSVTLTEKMNPAYVVQIQNGRGFQQEDGTFWLSGGSSLTVVPKENSGFNRTLFSEKLENDGTWKFRLEKRGKDGSLMALSRETGISYRLDHKPPELILSYNGSAYCPAVSQDAIEVQADKLKDEDSGVESLEYCICKWDDNRVGKEYIPCREGQTICLDEEGVWQIFFRTRDRVGNTKVYATGRMCLDKQSPQISVEGITHQKSYQSVENIHIQLQDKYLNTEQTKWNLTEKNRGIVNCKTERRKSNEGEDIYLEDLSSLSDGYYTLKIQGKDMAGNHREEEVSFSVNRTGSSYSLSRGAEILTEKYYVKEGVAFSVTEHNRDQLKKSAVTCIQNGRFFLLREGRDYQVSVTSVGDGWSYRYQLFQKCFRQEGAYTVTFQSLDLAGNHSDSREQDCSLEFFVDQSGPTSVLMGLEKEEAESGTKNITLWGRDNGKIQEMELWQNGVSIFSTSNEQEQTTVELSPGTEEFRILAKDWAGNQNWSENYKVYVAEEGMREKKQQETKIETEYKLRNDDAYVETDHISPTQTEQAQTEIVKEMGKKSDKQNEKGNRDEAGNFEKKAGMFLLAAAWFVIALSLLGKIDFS